MQPFYEQRDSRIQVGFLRFAFPPHLHAHVEIAHAFAGAVPVRIEGEEYVLAPGDTAIAFPHRVHGYPREEPGQEGLMLVFPPEISIDYGRLLLTGQVARPVLPAAQAHGDIPAMMRAIQEEYLGPRSETVLRAYIQVILARLLPSLCPQSQRTEGERGILIDAMRYLGEHFDQPVSLEGVARALGASKYHLSHLFSQRLGMNFRAYVNALRVERARAMLTGTDAPITQICYECGFENARTFNRAFLAACGRSPSAYREAAFFAGPTPEGDSSSHK